MLEMKHKSKSLVGSRNSLQIDEHALRNVISDDVFEDAIMLANFGKTGSKIGDEDLEVKVKSSRAFSVISDNKDTKDTKKYKNMNESMRSEIKSEID